MRGKHSKKRESKVLWLLILLILIAVFLYSSYQVYNWVKSNAELKTIEKEIFSEVVTEETAEDGVTTKVSINFEELKNINSDVVAWISIDNTTINYPITQTNNNDFYLSHDINKKYNSCGNLFLDCNTKNDFSEGNNVIYGHNLRAGGMFADLKKICAGDFGNEVYVKIYTPESEYTYQVIASYLSEQDLYLAKRNFKNNEKQEYVNKAIQRSNIKFKAVDDITTNMITLITCRGQQRTVVNALRIDQD